MTVARLLFTWKHFYCSLLLASTSSYCLSMCVYSMNCTTDYYHDDNHGSTLTQITLMSIYDLILLTSLSILVKQKMTLQKGVFRNHSTLQSGSAHTVSLFFWPFMDTDSADRRGNICRSDSNLGLLLSSHTAYGHLLTH